MTKKPDWQTSLWLFLLALTLAVTIRWDLSHLGWVSSLSAQGSPPPARAASSPTGYVLGQRQFLGFHERGTTYRWIAATQDFIASGPFASRVYQADTLPTGRPRLLPKIYAAWLTTVSWGLHLVTGEPIALSAERAALWEPLLSHVLAFLAVVALAWKRYGAAGAGIAGLFFALFPPIAGQFIPGVLTTRTWALLLAAYALSLHFPSGGEDRIQRGFSVRSALAASIALWLDPAFGFPVVLISGIVGVALIRLRQPVQIFLSWALVGSGLTVAAWLIDQAPWDPAAGELRYVHPWYALAWLGLGLGLDGGQRMRGAGRRRGWYWVECAAALLLISGLVHAQFGKSYGGWIHPGASIRRLTSLDETVVFGSMLDWFANVGGAEAMVVLAPVVFAAAGLVLSFAQKRRPQSESPRSWVIAAVLFAGVLTLSFFRIRWCVIAALLAVPLIGDLIRQRSLATQRLALTLSVAFLASLGLWSQKLSPALPSPWAKNAARPADLEALIYRHFSHWLASHTPGQRVAALAPPELSDSLVFHGGCHVLMSTAWESYPGQVAASRVLSAPEASEAQAILESRGITHVILPSWDPVLPLLVREPGTQDKASLYARLQRWVFPPYLRPMPYRLPSMPGFLNQKLVVFKVVPAQDEALSLSRLAEYFVEMDRDEPAGLVAKVLADSYPDDPNAAIARALVSEHANQPADSDRDLIRVAADAVAGKASLPWDRRVQRAIVLALGHRSGLARREIEACVASASRNDLFDLTPLQAYRLRTLATHFGAVFPDRDFDPLLAALGAEFSPAPPAG